MEFKVGVILSLIVLANADLLGSIRNLWQAGGSTSGEESGRSFSARSGGYHDDGDPYMMADSRQYGGGGGGGGNGGWGWGWGWGHGHDHQNLDLYSLLGGLSFASLLGATIIYLARRNTSGRRRRSADGLSYLDDDEIDFSEDPNTKGVNIIELIDTFLDNKAVFSSNSSNASSRGTKTFGMHLGPGVVPHKLT